MLFGKLKIWAIEIGGALLALLIALLAGYRKGSKSATDSIVAKTATEANKAVQQANQVSQKVDAQPPEQTQKDLDKWSRD